MDVIQRESIQKIVFLFSLQIQTLFFKLQSREYFFFIYSPLLRCSSECQDTIFFPYDFAFERNFRYWLKCGFSLNLSYSSSSSRFLFSFISRCEMLIKKKYEKNKIANKLNHARLCNLWIKLELV